MSILDDLFESVIQDAPVRSVLVGSHWTVVSSRYCGMAATMRSDKLHGHSRVRDVGRLHKKSALELAQYAYSHLPLEISIGIAALNSLIDIDDNRTVEINAVDVLAERGKGKNVALVGHFPFIPTLRPLVENLWVIEQKPAEGEYPAEAAFDLIPQADIVAITGSTLLNHTLDALLDVCPPGAPVMVLGPSTPLSTVLFAHGVTILSGVKIVDEQVLLRTVGQGATFQQVQGAKLLTMINIINNLRPGWHETRGKR